ncbi:HAD-IIIA family hydrolase [candidate division KSB3 bacterium]|uniref:HAD-IIIA family hydrolase n=1 Tax=candidate division KSB3 bacterium TaxID=2044937 RepID=A0A9D5K0A0_9BACT|nr:HAD-IIIA family hydrolase [candidate division KSB3 bacterium]MBD3327587.1 HAD-IIIA family hydrolase [candidate division KSB3 bacterium]
MRAHLQKIKLLVCDVDGVLTAGGIIIDDQGRETKRFDVKDDHGLKLLQRAGLQVALLSGRSSDIVTHRAKELNISYTIQGAKDKRKAYATLKQECGYQDDEIAYVGDDVVDIPILTQVGVAIAVQDAVEEVKAVAQYITARPGGHGAIREVVHLILKAQNHWKRLMERYYQ